MFQLNENKVGTKRKAGFDTAKKVVFYGQEKNKTTINIAKMNLAVHGLEGQIAEAITYYTDKFELYNKCDFVMANRVPEGWTFKKIAEVAGPNRKSYAVIWNPVNNLIASTGFAVISPKTVPCTYLFHAVSTDNFRISDKPCKRCSLPLFQ